MESKQARKERKKEGTKKTLSTNFLACLPHNIENGFDAH